MKMSLRILLFFGLLAGSATAQSSGTASKLIGDAFKNSLTTLKPVPENDRAAVIAFTNHVMQRLVTFREDGIAATTHRLGKSETHIEWRGLRPSSVRAGLVTDVERANGVSRKFDVGLASETHRTWNRTTGRWSEWRIGGYPLFPSTFHIRIRNGSIEVANSFHGTFGRGPGSPLTLPAAAPKTISKAASQAAPEWKDRPVAPAIDPIERKAIASIPIEAALAPTAAAVPEPTRQRDIHASLIVLAAILVGILLFSKALLVHPKCKGWFGERRVRNMLAALDPALYRSHHDLYLSRHDSEELTQIDHVVVSPYGIFVIETKNFTGWIFGSGNQPKWTQQIYRRKSRFQNPLHQNKLHVNSLAAHLGFDKNRFHSLVVFVGSATFKTPMPENVIRQGLISRILSRNTMLLTPPELEIARAKLAELDHGTDRSAASNIHRTALQARHC